MAFFNDSAECWLSLELLRIRIYTLESLRFCDRASWANCEVREKTNKMQQLDVYYQHFLNMFRASLCPSSPLVTAQHTTCSNTRLVLLKMGIMMPETC